MKRRLFIYYLFLIIMSFCFIVNPVLAENANIKSQSQKVQIDISFKISDTHLVKDILQLDNGNIEYYAGTTSSSSQEGVNPLFADIFTALSGSNTNISNIGTINANGEVVITNEDGKSQIIGVVNNQGQIVSIDSINNQITSARINESGQIVVINENGKENIIGIINGSDITIYGQHGYPDIFGTINSKGEIIDTETNQVIGIINNNSATLYGNNKPNIIGSIDSSGRIVITDENGQTQTIGTHTNKNTIVLYGEDDKPNLIGTIDDGGNVSVINNKGELQRVGTIDNANNITINGLDRNSINGRINSNGEIIYVDNLGKEHVAGIVNQGSHIYIYLVPEINQLLMV